jgi:glycerol-3-phosphate dehydrogenase
MTRLRQIEDDTFDVAIVGGGIVGCGVARDAALRGLRVALFEKHDFGSGTTSASTRIIHGGLRYLEMLDFRLVRLDLRERETLLRIAPHLVKPLEFLIPLFEGGAGLRLKLRVGLRLYDVLSYDTGLPGHRILSPREARAADPALDRPGLKGAAAYYDARVDSPERLCIESLIDARDHGARAFNYCEILSALRSGDSVTGVRVRDTLDGSELDVQARVVVNATGPWFENVAGLLAGTPPGRIRTTKGIHVVCPPLNTRALVLFSQVDARLLFAIPRLGQTWIGTTDTDYRGDPTTASATRDDVRYLIDSVRNIFPTLTAGDVRFTTAGVRALVWRGGRAASVSRMHKVVDGATVGAPGIVSILGGKITGYRAIAEEATDVVCRRLGVDRRSTTADTLLPGARGSRSEPSDLYDLYGSRADRILALARAEPDLAVPLSAKYPDIAAQVVFAVRDEHCLKLADFLRRRTLLGASADQGADAAWPAASLMARELGWPAARTAAEVDEYRKDIERTRAFRS